MKFYLLQVPDTPRNKEIQFQAEDDEDAKRMAIKYLPKEAKPFTDQCVIALLYELRHVHTWSGDTESSELH